MTTIFDTPYDRREGAGLKFASETKKAQFWSNLPKGAADDLKLVFNYFGRNLDGTPIGDETAASSVSPMSSALSKAYDKFQETADSLAGTPTATQLRSIEDRAKQITNALVFYEQKLTVCGKKALPYLGRALVKELEGVTSLLQLVWIV